MRDYQLIRTRRKSIALRVEEDGSLTVRAPLWTPKEVLDRFVQEKEGWIRTHQERLQALRRPYPPIRLQEGEEIPYLGESLRLYLTGEGQIQRKGRDLFLPRRKGEEGLRHWLVEEARTLLTQRTAFYSGEMGVTPVRLQMSGARRRWGSCNGKNGLNFSWRLIFCAPEAVDYVVVHELAHITHKNHSSAFWNRVEACLPDYKKRREWLREHQGVLDLL